MNVWAKAEMQRWRRPATKTAALGAVLLLHVVFLTPLLAWRSSPAVLVAPATQIALIAGDELPTRAASAVGPGELIDPQPAPTSSAAQSSPPPETASKPDSNLALMPLQNGSPQPLDRLINALALGGANVQAQPNSLKAEPAQASAVNQPRQNDKTCQILEGLQASLQQDAGARSAIARIPKAAKSVANAVLIWNGRWIDSADIGGSSALAPLESAVIQTVSNAPPNCQSELIHGPQLLTIGDARDTTVLAFGSGEWRWSDLIATLSPIMSP